MDRYSSADWLKGIDEYYRRVTAGADIEWEEGRSRWLVRRDAAIRALLTDERLSAARLAGSGPQRRVVDRNALKMIVQDAPAHMRLRKRFAPLISSMIDRNLTSQIASDASLLIDAFAEIAGPVDILTAFARPLPVRVICWLLGIPSEYTADVKASSDRITRYFIGGNVEFASDAELAMDTLDAILRALLSARQQKPERDIISQLATSYLNDDTISEEEMLSNLNLLFAAGYETTGNLIANAIIAMLGHGVVPTPPLWMTRNMVLECARYDPPVQRIGRVAHSAVRVADALVRPGDLIVCHLGAASRDERAFAEPYHLSMNGPARSSLSFGYGVHRCLGFGLAVEVVRVSVSTLFQRFPNMRLAPETKVSPDSATANRGPLSLNVYLD